MTTQKYLERKAESTNFMIFNCLDHTITNLENKIESLKEYKTLIEDCEAKWDNRSMMLEKVLSILGQCENFSYEIENALTACRAMETLENFMKVVNAEKN